MLIAILYDALLGAAVFAALVRGEWEERSVAAVMAAASFLTIFVSKSVDARFHAFNPSFC